MKNQSSKMRKGLLRIILSSVVMICLLVLPGIMFGQNPGDNPDAQPQAVPLDPGMSFMLILMGMLLSVKILRRNMHRTGSQTVAS